MNYPDLPPGYYWRVTCSYGIPRTELRERVLGIFYREIYTSFHGVARQYPGLGQEDIDRMVSELWNLHEQKLRNKTRKS